MILHTSVKYVLHAVFYGNSNWLYCKRTHLKVMEYSLVLQITLFTSPHINAVYSQIHGTARALIFNGLRLYYAQGDENGEHNLICFPWLWYFFVCQWFSKVF